MTEQDDSNRIPATLDEARQLNKLYYAMLLNVSDFVFAFRVEASGDIVNEWFTEGFETLTGYTANDLDNRSGWSRLIHPADREKVRAGLQDVLKNQSVTGELRLITRSGEVRWIQLTMQPVWQADLERVVRILGAAANITREKELQAQQSNFITNAIHELAHPVSSILMRLHLMRNQKDQWESHLDRLEPVANRLRRMLQDMREMAYLDRGLVTLDRSRVSLQQMVETVVNSRKVAASNHDVHLDLTLADHPLYVLVDVARIERAIANLLDNALQVTPKGEHIDVQVFASPEHKPVYAVLRVRHKGVLIEPDHPSLVFHPFQRPSEGQTTHSGLELTITRETVRLHGGEASVELNADDSSTFDIQLLLMDDTDRHITREIHRKPDKDETENE